MENFKSPKTLFYLNKELKNLPKPPPKDNFLALLKNKNNQKNKNITQTKTRSGNVIKETILFNVPNKGKGRSLEKVPSAKNNQNKNIYINYLDLNLNINKKRPGKNNIMLLNEKNKNHRTKNNSVGKRSRYNKGNTNNNNNYNLLKDFRNINVNEENKKKNNLLKKNINRTNNEINEINKLNQKYNSVCVSINNNYNYNLSLEKPKEETRERTETWQDKLNRINKQKETMNYIDYKKITDTDFFKKKLALKEKEEKEEKEEKINNILNKTENNLNFKQKIKELNSAPTADMDIIENLNINKELNEINDNNKKVQKKKTGILGFLRAFKDFLEPANLRRKNNIKNNIEQNEGIHYNKELKREEKIINNMPNTPKVENNYKNNKYEYGYNSLNTTPKNILYEKKRFLNKNINNNIYNDNSYDSCPISNNINNNNSQISSYSQKNVHIIGRKNYPENNNNNYYNNKTENPQKENSLLNFFGFGKNKIINKTQENIKNNKNIIKEFYAQNIHNKYNDANYNTTYIKKTKRRIESPPHRYKVTYEKDFPKHSYNNIGPNNNIFASYLNNMNNVNNNNNDNNNIHNIKQKLLERYDDDYNDVNLEENLNINAEKKIQEIKINIKSKRDNNNNFNYGSKHPFDRQYYNNVNDTNKINNSAIYYNNRKAYNTMDDLIKNPKPQNRIESCVINFNQNKKINNNNLIYNTPKPNYNKNMFNDNINNNSPFYNTYSESRINNNNNNIYIKPYDLSQSQRNITHNLNINTDSDNQSTKSAYTSKPLKKKIAKNISARLFRSNKFLSDNNNNIENKDSDSESNSDFSEISQNTAKTSKPNIYYKPFKNIFSNKNKGGITNNFFKKIFRRDKKYDTDDSYNSFNSDISNNYNEITFNSQFYPKKNNDNDIAINNITPLPSNDEIYYNKNYKKMNIRKKVINNKLHFYQKIYDYSIKLPLNNNGYYFSKQNLKILKLPSITASIYTKYYFKILNKPIIKKSYIDKKRKRIRNRLNIPKIEKCFFTKKNIFMINNTENISFENYDINNENININEEIKLSNKNYFSPSKNKKNIKDNTLIYSPQFGTKKEPKIDNKKEIATLNPSKSARDIGKIISIEVDLNNKKSNLHENTPIRNFNNSYSNIKINPSENMLYVKKKPNLTKIKDENKSKTYFKENKKIYINNNMNINAFNIDNNNEPKKNNKIICIDIDLNKEKQNKNIINKINNVKINENDINNKIIMTLNLLAYDAKNNINLVLDNLINIITKKNNNIRLPFMDILSNENIFVKIIIKKSIEEINTQKIGIYALICQQLCFKLNHEIFLNQNKTDEDLKTILLEECKLNFDNILNNINYKMNNNSLLSIIIFITELIYLNIININFGFYCYQNLYIKYKINNRNKYYYLDMIIIFLNKFGKMAVKQHFFGEIVKFIDNELINLINTDIQLPLFLRNKIIELIKIKKYQWN